jgi:hypothetical protein
VRQTTGPAVIEITRVAQNRGCRGDWTVWATGATEIAMCRTIKADRIANSFHYTTFHRALFEGTPAGGSNRPRPGQAKQRAQKYRSPAARSLSRRFAMPFQKSPESLVKTAAWFGEKRSAYSASPVSGRSLFSWCFESQLLRAGAAGRAHHHRHVAGGGEYDGGRVATILPSLSVTTETFRSAVIGVPE